MLERVLPLRGDDIKTDRLIYREKEADELELFFCHLFKFHNPDPDSSVSSVFVPPRYAINFVPAAPAPSSVSTVPSSVSTGYSVVSSVNFVPPIVSSTCIEPIT